MPFVDAHHHLWDPLRNPHPWLAPDAAIPFRYGGYEALKRPFLIADYRRLAEGHDLVASVTMEGEWAPDDPVAETRWLAGVRESAGVGMAHVAAARLTDPRIADVLAAHVAAGFVRGVRHKPVAAARGQVLSPGHPGSLTDPAFARGYAELVPHGLSFDLQVPWWQLDDAASLARRHPDVPMVLDHAGLPADRSPEGLAAWEKAIGQFARVPHARVKISGIGERGHPWSVARNRDIVLRILDAFGPERAMFASNFPVDGLTGSFDSIIGGYRGIVADFPLAERRRLFAGTAIETYRLDIAA